MMWWKGMQMASSPASFRLGSGTAKASAPLPPDNLYLPLLGVSAAWQSEEQPYAGRRTRNSAAQRAGLAYQRRVGEFLAGRDSNWRVLSSPWFAYCDWGGGKRRYCQPDFILADDSNSTAVLVEVKIRWTPAAWWQLEKLYLPVVRASKRWENLLLLCISRGYDPAIPAPAEPHFVDDVYQCKPEQFNLLIFK
jgi:hypothetical protein